MKIKQARGHVDTFSGKASELSRQLAFAGIAVIWIFKNSASRGIIPDDFVFPMFFFVLALAFDLLQYILGSVEWGIFTKIQEAKYKCKNEDQEVDSSPVWINYPHNLCFILKIAMIAIGYSSMIANLSTRL